MGRGGYRKGAGRPKGTKELLPRIKKSKMPSLKEQIQDDPNLNLYNTIKKYLSAENKKLFRELMPEHKTPLDSLKALRDFLVAKFNFYSIAEIESLEYARKIAKNQIEELETKGSINGETIPEKDRNKKKTELERLIGSKPKINPTLNTLASELRQYNELIDRIESGRPEQTVNIFNILKGNVGQQKIKNLTEELFRPSSELDEISEAEIIEETKEKDDSKDQ